jgi:hypothetical protein
MYLSNNIDKRIHPLMNSLFYFIGNCVYEIKSTCASRGKEVIALQSTQAQCQ